jgi:acyl-coenzyme A thioesterase PaaI-like protein
MSDDDLGRHLIQEQIQQIEALARAKPAAPPALTRLSKSVADLSRWMITTRNDMQLERAAEALQALVGALEIPPQETSRYVDLAPDGNAGPFVNQRSTHPLVGRSNPVSPAIDVRVVEQRVIGEVTFDARFEGNAGWVHGGFIAAGFDIVAVLACRLSGRAGPTGTLSIRYVAPTPVGVPLRYEGHFTRKEGRKLFAEVSLLRADDGALTAKAEAIAICRE